MQCHNCHFENIPGVPSCARCQSQMDLKQISVLPPRADPTRFNATKRERARISLRRFRSLFFLTLSELFSTLAYRRFHDPAKTSLPFNILIPGLGHYVVGYRSLGRRIMILWGVLILLNIFFIGTSLSAWIFLFVILVHFYAILFSVKETLLRYGFFLRLVSGILIFISLQILYYQTIGFLLGNSSRTIQLSNLKPSPIFANGDVLLYSGEWLRSSTYDYGDRVVYQIENGYGVDKIIGLPGDTVEIISGGIRLNGKPLDPDRMPLGTVPNVHFKTQLGSNEYFIVPSLLDIRFAGNIQDVVLDNFMKRWCRIESQAILGKIWWRLRPLSRFGSIE